MAYLTIEPVEREVRGQIAVPVSKYHLHRSLIMGWLAAGNTQIEGRSDARHVEYTLRAIRAMGARVVRRADGYEVEGGRYHARNVWVSAGSSGSTLQFLLGLASQVNNGPVILGGQHALMRRPIGPLLGALEHLGIRTAYADAQNSVMVFPGRPRGRQIDLSGMLSQWTSGILLLAPFADGPVTVHLTEPVRERTYIDLTVRMLRQFGIEVADDPEATRWTVPGGQRYLPSVVERQADWSSAAFLLALAALNPSRLTLTGVREPGAEHPEGRILQILQAMGLNWKFDEATESVHVVHGQERLEGTEIDLTDIPDLLPILCVIASLARGKTVLRHVQHARLKESDRVQAMLQLRRMGAVIEEHEDDLVIHGKSALQAATINTYNDHRVLMAYAIAGTAAMGTTCLNYPWAYRISYPEFLDHLAALDVSVAMSHGRTQRAEDLPSKESVLL